MSSVLSHSVFSQGYLGEKAGASLEPDQIGIGQAQASASVQVRDAGAAETATRSGATDPGRQAAETRPTNNGGISVGSGSDEAGQESPSDAVTITSAATVHAPDGTPDHRTTIGSAETIEFTTGGQVANWSSNLGWPAVANGRSIFRWAAPELPNTATITATSPITGQSSSINMNVLAPSRIAIRKGFDLSYPAGTAGAGMVASVLVHPRNVNFGWLGLKEDPGPASNVTGYFVRFPLARLRHVPNPGFTRVGWNNQLPDTAATVPNTLPPPWTRGGYDWVIPTRYQAWPAIGAGHRLPQPSRQQFRIDAAGRVTVIKQGTPVSRSP